MNNRRILLIVLGAAPFTPRAVFAQPKQPVLIGWLSLSSRESGAHMLAALKDGLAALGWKDGSHIRIEERWADGHDDRLVSLTQELAVKKPALIVARGLRAAIDAAKTAPNIPLVMVSDADPVAAGLVTSLARPGGMITGVAGFTPEIAGKLLELLLAAAPKLKRVGFLAYANNPNLASVMGATRRSATQYSVEARFAEVASPEQIESAMLRLARDGSQALVVLPGQLLTAERRRIMKLALAQRWPVTAGPGGWADAGALVSYGAELVAVYHRAAYFVDRILKGTKPDDIPIEQPTTFELTVNMKTAKLLGLTMPPEIMVRATRVIE